MRILLINVPHPAIGSRIPDDHLPPLGLLAIGGPLIDAGHEVRLLDADRTNMPVHKIVAATVAWRPDAVVWFKFTEMVLQCRPTSLWRTFLHPDPALRHAMRWYSRMGRRVWPHEIADFLRGNRLRDGPTLAAFWRAPQDGEEEAMLAAHAGRDVQIRPPVSA